MEREALFAILLFWICGPLILVVSLWPARLGSSADGRRFERATWVRIWMPLVPAILALAWLVGWALQEPDPADESVLPVVLWGVSPIALVWLRALVRATHALFLTPREALAHTVGLLRPRVIVSHRLAEALDSQALRAVEEHEAAHRRHRDPLRIWLAQFATDLQWPCPAAQKRLRSWAHALEFARDEETRARGVDGADLAAAVIAALRLKEAGPGPAEARLEGVGTDLTERVTRLLVPLPSPESARVKGSWMMALLGVGIALTLVLGVMFGDDVVRHLPGVVP